MAISKVTESGLNITNLSVSGNVSVSGTFSANGESKYISVANTNTLVNDRLQVANAEASYVSLSGDTMTGSLDVTGTVTADGLTVEGSVGNASLETSGAELRFTRSGLNNINCTGASGRLETYTGGSVLRHKIDSNGDISFYEDTGSTPKFFWDASAESLGIGTTSPASTLSVTTADSDMATFNGTGAQGGYIAFERSGSAKGYIGSAQQLVSGGSNDDFNVRATNNLTFAIAASEKMRIDTNGNVGIGTSSPAAVRLDVTDDVTGEAHNLILKNEDATVGNKACLFLAPANGVTGAAIKAEAIEDFTTSANRTADLIFETRKDGTLSEKMRIDSSGNLLVGKTAEGVGNVGFQGRPDGFLAGTRNGGTVSYLNRLSSPGEILRFQEDSSTVGSIGVGTQSRLELLSQGSELTIGTSGAADSFFGVGTGVAFSVFTTFDDSADLGRSNARFDDIHATNGTIQTSDRNEKQDIEELSEAEQRVAVAAKGLLRKYRWIKRVEEKGEDARIHFGIIAQDLQAAFEAEGLDAGRYAMFIHSEWWETYTDVPAVEAVEAQDAVYDEEGNLVSEAVEAVEAKEAYTRIDTYNTEEEAPEGAVKKSRMGVRYSELLAFIIVAI